MVVGQSILYMGQSGDFITFCSILGLHRVGRLVAKRMNGFAKTAVSELQG